MPCYNTASQRPELGTLTPNPFHAVNSCLGGRLSCTSLYLQWTHDEHDENKRKQSRDICAVSKMTCTLSSNWVDWHVNLAPLITKLFITQMLIHNLVSILMHHNVFLCITVDLVQVHLHLPQSYFCKKKKMLSYGLYTLGAFILNNYPILLS